MPPLGPDVPITEPLSSSVILLVTGAHLHAEVADRPLAYQLSRSIDNWQQRQEDFMNATVSALVLCDIWYLNNPQLHSQPTISIGAPQVNALTAAWGTGLPFVMMRENHLAIQLDPEFLQLRVSVWGVDRPLTAEAMRLFEDRYCAEFLRAVVTQSLPEHG